MSVIVQQWIEGLCMIERHHRPFVYVGDLYSEIPERTAQFLERVGCIDILHHPMGRRAYLTERGKQVIEYVNELREEE